jgi:hypothetical protein
MDVIGSTQHEVINRLVKEHIGSLDQLFADEGTALRNRARIVVLLEQDAPGRVQQGNSHHDPHLWSDFDPQMFGVRETVVNVLDLGGEAR